MNILRSQLISKSRYFVQSSLFKRPTLAQSNVTRSLFTLNAQFKSLNLRESHTDSSGDGGASDAEVQKFLFDNKIYVRGYKNDPVSKPVFTFENLEFPSRVQQKIVDLEMVKPTAIQAQSIPILMEDKDLIGIAQTGSGKTLAYLLPAFKKVFPIHQKYFNNEQDRQSPKVLILAPTRELAQQIFDVIRVFKMFKTICLYGGSDRNRQIEWLKRNDPLFVISTPGRLNDLLEDGCITLRDIEYLVLDEADRMLDMGFEPQISKIIKNCPDIENRQTMMFSATWPKEVQSLVSKYLKKDHAFLSIGGTELKANRNIKQNIIVCDGHERNERVIDIIQHTEPNSKIIIFTNTKIGCDRLSYMISKNLRIRASPLHGDLSQRQRERTLENFRNNQLRVVCATNVAARGLDIDDVNVVINYDMPEDAETYVHRIGRTGRKENKGEAYSFFTDRSKTGLAADLMKVLQEANNEIPDDLREIAEQNGRYFKNDRHNNNYRNNGYGNNRKYPNKSNKYGGGNRYNRGEQNSDWKYAN